MGIDPTLSHQAAPIALGGVVALSEKVENCRHDSSLYCSWDPCPSGERSFRRAEVENKWSSLSAVVGGSAHLMQATTKHKREKKEEGITQL